MFLEFRQITRYITYIRSFRFSDIYDIVATAIAERFEGALIIMEFKMEHSGMSEDQQQQFIDKIADNMRAFGISETVGRVLGTIYMARRPMTLDELSEATGMSKMRMSQVVREMTELGIAEKVHQRGVRKDLIQVEDNYYSTFISLFTSNWRKAVGRSRSFERNMRQNIAAMEADEKQSEAKVAAKEELVSEMNVWSEYYDWIDRLINLFESGEIFQHVPKKEGEIKDGE